MKRLIDVDEFIKAVNKYTELVYDGVHFDDEESIIDYQRQNDDKVSYIIQGFSECYEILHEQPIVTETGEWIIDEFGHKCSHCNNYVTDEFYKYDSKNYCPNCGIKMD